MPAARCVECGDLVPDPDDPIYILDGHCPGCRTVKLIEQMERDEDGDVVQEPTDDYDVPADPE